MEVDAELRARYEGVMASIDAAAQNAGRSREDLTLIVVTKFHPASLVRELHSLGVRHIGENRHQDAEPKARELGDLPLTWHFVGQLQSNKARAVTEYCRVIHSLDRSSLLRALDRADLSRHVGRLRGRHRRGRDTPAHRHRNHRKPTLRPLISEASRRKDD